MTHRSTLFAAFLVLSASISYAAMPDKLYREALQAAQNKVLRLNQNTAGALSSSVLKALFGRYYQQGDSWDVVAWQFNHTLIPEKRTRATSERSLSEIGVGGVFHYEVLNLKYGVSPSVTVQITQRNALGLPVVDSRVVHLNLVFNDQLVQGEKTYFTQGNRDGIRVFPDGIRSRISPLELFPLDVPDIVTAEHKSPSNTPPLPDKVRQIAEKIGFQPNLSQCSWFEQDDFFGRPVQVLWQQGDPWPSYIKTTGGIALLIHKGTL